MSIESSCPFCGSREQETQVFEGYQGRKYYRVVCFPGGCGAEGPDSESPDKAEELWNNRQEYSDLVKVSGKLHAENKRLRELLKLAVECLQDDGHEEPYQTDCMKCSCVADACAALEGKHDR